jgi:hypothetical protein
MTDAELDELEKLAKAATWHRRWEYAQGIVRSGDEYIVMGGFTQSVEAVSDKNGSFIAAADPDTVLKLIAEVRRLKRDLAATEDDRYGPAPKSKSKDPRRE